MRLRHTSRASVLPLSFFIMAAAVFVMSGCMGLFHPQAEHFYQEAKGSTERETALRLISMMEDSAQQAKHQTGTSPALTHLHDQFHALHHTLGEMSGQQTAGTAHELALTLQKELQTILHRVWKVDNHPALRTIHLDLFLSRLQELRTALQTLSA